MQVSASLIDLGRVKEVGGFVGGEFLVSNPSTQMPLHFSLTSERAQLSVSEGHLVGRDTSRLNGGSLQSDMIVKFSLPVNGYGLIEDKIIVQNLSCSGQNAELVLRLFVDAAVVEAAPELALPHFQPKPVTLISSPPDPDSELSSRGIGSGFLSIREFNLLRNGGKKLPLLPAFGGESGSSCDRKIRKASSAGDFFFANLAPQPGKGAASPHQRNSLGSIGSQDLTPFLSNSFLSLGTVFVSPENRRSTLKGASTVKEIMDVPIYTISDLRPYHSSLLLTNFLQEPIELQVFSTLRMCVNPEKSVITPHSARMQSELSSCITGSYNVDAEMEAYCRSHGVDSAFDERDDGSNIVSELATKLVCCGRPFVIQPYCTTRLLVSYSDLKRLSSSEVTRLSSGKLSAVEGLLIFSKVKSSPPQESSVVVSTDETEDMKNMRIGGQAVEVLNIRGSICLSEGNLAKNYIELGKVGYANKWADVEFEITVENTSDADLVYKLVDVPECFEILLNEHRTANDVTEIIGCVAPRESGTLRVTLCTSKLKHLKHAGTCSWRICLLNCNNPENLMELVVEAEMTICTLRFGGLTDDALLLPHLTLPALPSASPCSMQFVVRFSIHGNLWYPFRA